MSPIKLAIRLESLRKPLRKAIELVGQLGAQGFTVSASGDLSPDTLSETGRRELSRKIQNMDLNLAGLLFPDPRSLTDAQQLDYRIDQIKKTLQLSFQLRCPLVCCSLGPVPESDDAMYTSFRDILNDVGQFAEYTGSTLAVHTGSTSHESIAAILNQHTQGGLGICYDPAANLVHGFDYLHGVQELSRSIIHLQVRDAIRATNSIASHEVPIGTGEVDWQAMMAALEEIHYDRYWCIDQNAGKGVDSVTQAITYLKSLIF